MFRHAGDGSIVVTTHEAIVRALRTRDAAAVRRCGRRFQKVREFLGADEMAASGTMRVSNNGVAVEPA